MKENYKMKTKYTKKQITEAISYWKGALKKMNESTKIHVPCEDRISDFPKSEQINSFKSVIKPFSLGKFLDTANGWEDTYETHLVRKSDKEKILNAYGNFLTKRKDIYDFIRTSDIPLFVEFEDFSTSDKSYTGIYSDLFADDIETAFANGVFDKSITRDVIDSILSGEDTEYMACVVDMPRNPGEYDEDQLEDLLAHVK